MISVLLRWGFRRFGNRYNYDIRYMAHVTDVSTAAGVRLAVLPVFSQFRGPKNARDVWAGALLGSTREGDCGPCVQLITDMALEAGVAGDQLVLCLQGKAQDAGDVGLGFMFSQAAISDAPELDGLRSKIEARFGAAAVNAASFAASSGRVYPVLKRGLGFGQTCREVNVLGNTFRVRHDP